MTNSYNLSRNNKIVFFHGLNNNPQGFDPLVTHFKNLGFETELIILPCHGENRHEAKTDKEALQVFDQSMKKLQGQPYYAIAFSHGALYLELWMEKNLPYKPEKQILLAPALYIRKQQIIVKALSFLPSFVKIMSLQPKKFRRYNILSAREYNILVQGILTWQKLKAKFRVPTMVIIDPQDELVDVQKLKPQLEKLNPGLEVKLWDRPQLKKSMGAHHIIFHPEYFGEAEWKDFTRKLEAFLVNTSAEV